MVDFLSLDTEGTELDVSLTSKRYVLWRGPHSTVIQYVANHKSVSSPASDPAALPFQNFIPEEFLKLRRFITCTTLNSGQKLDNVGRTHIALASGKQVIQKDKCFAKVLVAESLSV